MISNWNYLQNKGNKLEIKSKLWFLCTALLVFYESMKFKVDSFYSLEVMALTKIQTKNFHGKLPNGNTCTSKTYGGRFMVVHCTSS